jgi:hypothetical protein
MCFLDSKVEAPPEMLTVQKDDKATKEPNPAYDVWVATDQQVLNLLVNTLSLDILVSVIGMEIAAEVWGGNQGDVRFPVQDAGLKPSRRSHKDKEGRHDYVAVLHQDEGLH